MRELVPKTGINAELYLKLCGRWAKIKKDHINNTKGRYTF